MPSWLVIVKFDNPELEYELGGGAHKRLFACGSMELAILSVRPGGTRFFALCERKKRNTKEDKVPLRTITSELPRNSCD
jgi:hypothetical protein